MPQGFLAAMTDKATDAVQIITSRRRSCDSITISRLGSYRRSQRGRAWNASVNAI